MPTEDKLDPKAHPQPEREAGFKDIVVGFFLTGASWALRLGE
jgi:hypothetical protein